MSAPIAPPTAHPVLAYDEDLVVTIASRLDLRVPNAQALHKVAQRFDLANGETFEAVCQLATAVGKTYLAAGLIEYLAAQGVRNILIVTPGRTVLNKTIDNFTSGHPKAVPGMDSDHLLVTADNFNASATRAAFADDGKVKLFVFTVQSLLKPAKDFKRKAREYQEWLGEAFHDYLTGRDDLVVIGDEHHVYQEDAVAFSAALNDLHPMAVIGLTATCAASQEGSIIYDYPLAAALRDKLVKTPVLVGRTDDHKDLGTQLSDGLALLRAKQMAANAWQKATGAKGVNAVMLVVCERIDQANQVAEILSRPTLLGDDAEKEVLVIHSQSDDEALAQLAAVEEPDSAVRVIISVSMLKEGWDVKNIFVIASLRPSVSDTLTEQTLGRGLRLPYGKHTGEELLDTLEVLSHDRYERLMASAGVLIKGITNVRVLIPPTSGPGASQTAGGPSAPPVDLLVPTTGAVVTYGGHDGSSDEPVGTLTGEVVPDMPGMAPNNVPTGFVITTADSRVEQATASAEAILAVPALAERQVSLPRVTRTMGVPNFSLSDIDDNVFADLGHKVAGAHTAQLDRKLLEVVDDGDNGFALVPRQGAAIDASVVNLPLGGTRTSLIQVIMNLDFIPDDETARNGAARLVDAAIKTAGGEDKLATYHQAAAKLIQRTLRSKFKTTTPVEKQTITVEPFTKGRTTHYGREPNRYGDFRKHAAYGPWERSTHAYNWFDSEPERKLANLLDADLGNDDVRVWCRILRGEFSVAWAGGTYTPDFYACVADVHYLLEVKADRDVADDEVQAKKEAAKKLARAVSDQGKYGTWRYLLISEDDLRNIKNVGDLLRIADA